MTVIAKVGSGDQGRVGIAFYNSYGAEIARTQAFVSSTSWAKYTVTGTTPSSFAFAWIYAWKYSGSSYLYVDNFSVTQ